MNICNLSSNFCTTDLPQFRAGWLCNTSTTASSRLDCSVTGTRAVVEQSLVTGTDQSSMPASWLKVPSLALCIVAEHWVWLWETPYFALSARELYLCDVEQRWHVSLDDRFWLGCMQKQSCEFTCLCCHLLLYETECKNDGNRVCSLPVLGGFWLLLYLC